MDINIIEGSVNKYKETDSIYIFDFGDLKKGHSARVTAEVLGVDRYTLNSTCGCSTVQVDDSNRFTAQYNDTHIVAPFSKVLVLNYIEKGINKQAQVKLKGNIIR